MKEIRLHGIGGLGTVKAGEILVHAAVLDGKFGNSTPFFGFERQGAPVTSFVRLDDRKIRPKNQIYHPNCAIVIDPSLLVSAPVFEGLAPESFFILNTKAGDVSKLAEHENIRTVAYLNATQIALDELGRAIPNTVMLGAFVRATGWVRKDLMEQKVRESFGEKNVTAFHRGYEEVQIQQFDR
ncbi:MAG TPA: 2-oxoacid:acceptor oxidoreductase family protein [Clostridia bacterium]|nr:2-oxoacid:acceptor oxidoreductase family protein [Clostridia bacterium]